MTVLGQHLVNLKCMFPERSEAEVLYTEPNSVGADPAGSCRVRLWHRGLSLTRSAAASKEKKKKKEETLRQKISRQW